MTLSKLGVNRRMAVSYALKLAFSTLFDLRDLEPLIRIRRADLTPCPKPPEVLDGWLKPGWHSVEAETEVLASRNFPDRDSGTITVAFEDDEQRVTGLGVWAAARTKWAVAERPPTLERPP